MATKQKIKPVAKGITPKGVFIFPYLNKPDDKFKAEGEYRVKLKVEGPEATAFLAEMEKAYTAAIAAAVEEQKALAKTPALAAKITVASIKKASDKPFKPELNDETGEETGAYLFTFKKKAAYKNKDGEMVPMKVDLFDAAKKPIDPKKTLIYGGTVGKVAYEAMFFYTPALGAGLTLRLQAVQVIELRSGGSRDADSHGFGDEGEGLGDPQAGEESTPGAGEEPTEF